MNPQRLQNGHFLIPATMCINGECIVGLKEVAPGTEEYEEWMPPAKETAKEPAKQQH
ncbi:MAG TPA: hypothetical protein VGK74_04595 [Symbiobacteriaceae bacterium]|jgi:hypothetical protein